MAAATVVNSRRLKPAARRVFTVTVFVKHGTNPAHRTLVTDSSDWPWYWDVRVDVEKEDRQEKGDCGAAQEEDRGQWGATGRRRHRVLGRGDGPLQRHALVEAVMRRNFTPS